MEPIYAPAYRVVDGCLLETRNSRHGPYERKLCNFAPWIVSEITLSDGVETTTWIRLRGKHQSGRTLPEIEIPAAELSGFQWLAKRWGMDCILEVGQSVKDALRYAIQTTAQQAEKQTVFTVTGWRRINGEYHFLMPGDEQHTVTLPGKMHGYTMARKCSPTDIRSVAELLLSKLAPEEILWPLIAFAFLTPLNHFLKLAGCEPKFVLFLVGKTGSRKSTLAALMLSFFGKFTASELPLSFRDTANSILHHSFALKDVLTCIDDYHPAGRQEEQKLTATAQSIMRAYGDRTGKGRLRADASPMESRPPQGNAIVTAEFPPDIGESGTARYFSLELKGSDVNLQVLSSFQKEAAEGSLQRCMYGYLRWLKERFLSNPDTEQEFISMLQTWFQQRRDRFQVSNIRCHGRVPETVAWLQLGMDMFLCFLKECGVYAENDCEDVQERFRQILYGLAQKQAQSIEEDKPTHKFIQKIYALLDSDQAHLLDRTDVNELGCGTCLGYQDSKYLYLYSEVAHKLVRNFCEAQGESFSCSCRSLLKALAEESLIEPGAQQNTRPLRVGTKQKRVIFLYREKAERIRDAAF